MAMLVLIGLGLWDEKDISLRGLEEAKQCDVLYLETYTSRLFGTSTAALSKLIGKEIQEAPRSFVESGEILTYAKRNRVGLLVGGDPLIATTHTDLLLRCRDENVNVHVVHNTSIYSAIADTGLQMYKFGRAATVAFWRENFEPTSFYETIADNRKRGLHTMLFLDIDREHNRYMSAQEAIQLLLRIEKQEKLGAFTEETPIVVGCRLGSPEQLIAFGTAGELAGREFGEPLHILIVPGKLHEMEEKFLSAFKNK